MNEQLFRKKTIERVSSPEQLNDYIKVSNPGVWMTLLCVIILLAGVCVWGVFGRLYTRLTVSAVSQDGTVVCYVPETDVRDVESGMTVIIDGTDYHISDIEETPVQVTDDLGAYVLHVGGLETGEWVYAAYIDGTLVDGVYEAKIITESIAPMSFLLN